MNPTSSDEHKPEDQQNDPLSVEQIAPEGPLQPDASATEDVQNDIAETATKDDKVTVKEPPAETEDASPAEATVSPNTPPVVTTAPASAEEAEHESAVPAEENVADDKLPAKDNDVSAKPEQPAVVTAVSGGPDKSKKKKLVTFAIATLGALLIAGGVTFAYFGLVASTKPETVLKDALYNTLEADQVTFDGSVNIPVQEEAGVPAMKIDFVSQSDTEKQASAATINFAISGVDFSFEARILDDDVYVKVGDLSTIKSFASLWMAESFGADAAYAEMLNGLLDEASKTLSDQWIIIDSTLLEQFGGSCVTEAQFALTEDDKKILEEQFTKNPFATIDSNTSENLDGVETIKYAITIDNKKGSAYVESLSELSMFKAINDCTAPSAAEGGDTELSAGDIISDGETKLTVWVDKDAARIHKLAFDDFEFADLEGDTKIELDFEAVLNYDTFTVEAPENPKPALQVINELQSLFILGGEGLLGE